MKRVNSYYRKHKTLDGCTEIDDVTIEKINNKLLRSPGKPFSDMTLRLNRNQMKEYESGIKRQQALLDAGDGWVFNGGRIVIDRNKGYIRLCDSSNEVNERIKKLGVVFYSTASDGTPQMMYFEHLLSELLEATRKYDELYPEMPINNGKD
jgi:hypothetical protein